MFKRNFYQSDLEFENAASRAQKCMSDLHQRSCCNFEERFVYILLWLWNVKKKHLVNSNCAGLVTLPGPTLAFFIKSVIIYQNLVLKLYYVKL